MSTRTPLVLSMTLVLLVSPAAPAQVTSTWTGASGNWTTPALWSPAVPNNGVPPGTTYNANVNGSGTIAVTSPVGVNALTFGAGTVDVQAASLSVGSVAMSGGTINVSVGARLDMRGEGNNPYDFNAASRIAGSGDVGFGKVGLVTSAFTFPGEFAAAGLEIDRLFFGYPPGLQLERLTVRGGGVLFGGGHTVNGPANFAGGAVVGSVQANGGATINGLSLSHPAFSTGGTVTLNGGTSTWSSGNITTSGGGGGRLTINGTLVQTSSGNLGQTFGSPTGSVENNGTYRKLSASQTSLGRATFYNNGLLEVMAGTMLFNPAGMDALGLRSSGIVHVAPGASIGGQIQAAVVRGGGTLGGISVDRIGVGNLYPGEGVGSILVRATDVVGLGSLNVELNGNVPAAYDQVLLGTEGAIALGSSSRLVATLGYHPATMDALLILYGNATTLPQLTGTFSNAPPGQFFTVGTFEGITYEARALYTQHSVTLTDFRISAIPEPGSLALGALAAAVLWRYRWRADAKPRPSVFGAPE